MYMSVPSVLFLHVCGFSIYFPDLLLRSKGRKKFSRPLQSGLFLLFLSSLEISASTKRLCFLPASLPSIVYSKFPLPLSFSISPSFSFRLSHSHTLYIFSLTHSLTYSLIHHLSFLLSLILLTLSPASQTPQQMSECARMVPPPLPKMVARKGGGVGKRTNTI